MLYQLSYAPTQLRTRHEQATSMGDDPLFRLAVLSVRAAARAELLQLKALRIALLVLRG